MYDVKPEQLSEQERKALIAALEEMNKDAQGNAIAALTNGKGADTTLSGGDKRGTASSKSRRAEQGKVTKTVAGSKELVVPVNVLRGRGYPAAANLNEGS